MCLVISGVFGYLAFSFYQSADTINMIINGTISLIFIILMVRNIIKTKNEKANRVN